MSIRKLTQEAQRKEERRRALLKNMFFAASALILVCGIICLVINITQFGEGGDVLALDEVNPLAVQGIEDLFGEDILTTPLVALLAAVLMVGSGVLGFLFGVKPYKTMASAILAGAALIAWVACFHYRGIQVSFIIGVVAAAFHINAAIQRNRVTLSKEEK